MTTGGADARRVRPGGPRAPTGSRNPCPDPGCPYDDAVAESSLETPEREIVRDRAYESQEEARQEISKHVELCHDTVRQHSKLGYVSPIEYERENEDFSGLGMGTPTTPRRPYLVVASVTTRGGLSPWS